MLFLLLNADQKPISSNPPDMPATCAHGKGGQLIWVRTEESSAPSIITFARQATETAITIRERVDSHSSHNAMIRKVLSTPDKPQ